MSWPPTVCSPNAYSSSCQQRQSNSNQETNKKNGGKRYENCICNIPPGHNGESNASYNGKEKDSNQNIDKDSAKNVRLENCLRQESLRVSVTWMPQQLLLH